MISEDEFTFIAGLDGESLFFDLPGFRVGVAEYGPGITGCTIISFDRKSAAAVDIRRGDPAISEFGYDGLNAR